MIKTLQTLLLAFCALLSAPASANPTPVKFYNKKDVPIKGQIFAPTSSGLVPAVVMMHGCSGMYSNSDPTKGLAILYKEWGERLANAGYVALVIDSFSGREVDQDQCGNNKDGVSEVTERPYDAYAAVDFLKRSYSGMVDSTKIALLGWSHGGSSTMSTLSNTMVSEFGKQFVGGIAFYPGCGLYGAFGGIKNSTYVPYAPLLILHGSIDPLYTSNYCQNRITNANDVNMDMVLFYGAKHSFDNARTVDSQWTLDDFNAKIIADQNAMTRLCWIFKTNLMGKCNYLGIPQK